MHKKNIIHNNNVDKPKNVVYNRNMREKKYFIDAVLEKEKKRNEYMRLMYEKRILELPKGSLVVRELKGKKYCYLRFREGEKVVQKYAGTIERERFIRAQIEERKHLSALVAMLEEENKRIVKMEGIK